MHLLAICMSLEKCLFSSCVYFLILFFFFLPLSCMSSLYILDINPLIDNIICKYFLSFYKSSLHFDGDVLCCAVQFQFDIVPFFLYFCFHCLGRHIHKNTSKTDVNEVTVSVFFQEFYGFRSYVQVFTLCCSVATNSLRPHGKQQGRILCPLPSPRTVSNSTVC